MKFPVPARAHVARVLGRRRVAKLSPFPLMTVHYEEGNGLRHGIHRCFSSSDDHNLSRFQAVIPGMSSTTSPYGSLGDPMPSSSSLSSLSAASWQATHNIDVQRVTQNAMIYELQQSQTKTIETVVPWFLRQMPPSYFQQVPDRLRTDHIKAIAAVQDANMVRIRTVSCWSSLLGCLVLSMGLTTYITGLVFESQIPHS
jgi:hypothetical protein